MSRLNRRRFLQAASAAAVFSIVPPHVIGAPGKKAPSEKLNIAGIGIGGQGGGVLRDMATENIVALCDIDFKKAAGTFKAFRVTASDSLGNESVNWFSPDLRMFVKRDMVRTERNQQGPGRRIVELKSRDVPN